jgi:mannose-6-phosphate isomerase
MTAAAIKLPPNPIRHFYRGGPAIAELRGIDVGGDHSPEEWIGSASTLFGEAERGLSRLPDGTLVRDALAADPDAWLGADHAARFGASPALLVKLLDAGERLPVHHHPDAPFAREHLGLAFGKTEAWIVLAAREGAEVAVGWREDVAEEALRAWVDDQDHDALLGALNPLPVSAGDAIFVPAGVPHAIGEGILIAELQEPTDLSVLLEWDGFGIDDEQAATLGLGWDVALASVERSARDPEPLRGPRTEDGTVSEMLPAAAAPFFSAQRVAPGGGSVQLPAGFAVVIVVEGAGTLAGLEVSRGDAVLVRHAAGPVRADGDLVALACRPPGVALDRPDADRPSRDSDPPTLDAPRR